MLQERSPIRILLPRGVILKPVLLRKVQHDRCGLVDNFAIFGLQCRQIPHRANCEILRLIVLAGTKIHRHNLIRQASLF